MHVSRSSRLAAAAALLALTSASPALAQSLTADDGRSIDPLVNSSATLRSVRHWNQVAIDASGLDHTAPVPGDGRDDFAEQLGPGRSARAMAIAHIAMFEAVNAIAGSYESYVDLPRAPRRTSTRAAIAQSMHDTLVVLFPAQKAALDEDLREDLRRIQNGREKQNGIELGQRAAAAILALRQDDGADHDEPLVNVDWPTSDEPGHWRQDPVSTIPLALGAHWSEVEPFALASAEQFRTPPPPAMTSAAYTQAFDEVKRLGGDGDGTSTERTDEQAFVGIFWAYDGTPSLCAPPRLYNQVATTISRRMRSNAVETARLLALLNVAMADAGIAIWESKYYWDFWRPVTGVREADPGTGPTQAGDGNPDTLGDVAWTPLGAPASNVANGVDFTPPFPAYPSGHAGFGGTLFQVLRRFYGTDRIPFVFVSDEWNGVTVGADGEVRPLIPRFFRSLSQAEEENGQSRIYLGIHWAFDKTEGIAQGRKIGDWVFDHVFRPRRGR
jgi:hypothetical protein